MNITVLQQNLLPKLQDASRFIASKSALPVLAGVHISAQGGQLRLRSTDLKVGYETFLGGKIEQEGECILSTKVLVDLLSTLQPGPVTMHIEDTNASIQQGKTKAQLSGFPIEDFPPFPDIGRSCAEMDVSVFHASIEKVGFAASLDETRPVLASVYLRLNQDTGTFVTSDGYRLALVQGSVVRSTESEQVILVPAKALSETARIIGKQKSQHVSIHRSQELAQVSFIAGDTSVIIHETAGDFPKYNTIIPQTFANTLSMEREELLAALKTTLVFAKENASIVSLSCEKTEVKLSATGGTAGKNEVTLEAQYSGAKRMEIAFNAKFITDVLTKIQEKHIVMKMNEELKPVLLRPSDDENFTYILMPFKK